MAAAGAGLGRTLDDHEENRDHVSRVSIVNSDCYLHICRTANQQLVTSHHLDTLRYKNVVIVCGGGVAKGSREQRIFARTPAAAAAAEG